MDITPEMQKLFDAVDAWDGRLKTIDEELETKVLYRALRLRDSFRPECPITEELVIVEDDMHDWWVDQDWVIDRTGRRIILQPAAEGETTGIYRWEIDNG